MAVAVPSREEGAAVPSPVTTAEATALGADDVLARLRTGVGGLPEDEAARRLAVAGPNAVRTHRVHALSVLASQLRSPLLLRLAVTELVPSSGRDKPRPRRGTPAVRCKPGEARCLIDRLEITG